ncbi:MAG: phosphotransferase family protein [Porticoccaceae bacterium]|nr:phosphotransferase family protein [Porticoccaceae bacterium]
MPKVVKQLEGGLTNTSYLIEAGSERAVLRINNPVASQLGVNRQTEITILKKLDPLGLVPKVYFSDSSILVSEYIEGFALDSAKTSDPSIKKQIENALQSLQSIDCNDLHVRNYNAYCQEYCSQINALCLNKSIQQKISQIAQVIDTQDWRPVLCHHDLIPENIILGNKGLIIIDWEYALLGHPQFDYLRIFKYKQTDNNSMSDIKIMLRNFQRIMDQLWYAIRYPELQPDLQSKLNDIIETGQTE